MNQKIIIRDHRDLATLKMLGHNTCWKCKKEFKVRDMTVSTTEGGGKRTRIRFHEECYQNWGY